MTRYRATVAYDGTDFHGFQLQATDRTVQGELENALGKLDPSKQRIVVLGAGRTDSGVHATGQVIAFDLHWQHPLEKLNQAINAHLPPDVSLYDLTPATADFHPRFDALARRYQYKIDVRPWRSPLRRHYTWHIWPPPNLNIMQQAAQTLIGQHDFAAFGSPPKAGGSTQREIYQANWQQHGQQLTLTIEANAFLYRMVRRIVGAMHKLGSGKWTLQQWNALLAAQDIGLATPAAPPNGLQLVAIRYPQNTDEQQTA